MEVNAPDSIVASQQSTNCYESDLISSQRVSDSKKCVNFEELNFNEGYAGHVIQSILRKAQRDTQTVQNIELKLNHGKDFITSMKNVKRWSAGVIFKKGKCYLDEEVLEMAASAKRKKEDAFRQRIRKFHDDFLKRKLAFKEAMKQLNSMETKTLTGIPLKLLKPLVGWKKRKGDKPIPVKRKDLEQRWIEVKKRKDLTLEEFLSTTNVYTQYLNETGTKLTEEVIKASLNDDVAVDDVVVDDNAVANLESDSNGGAPIDGATHQTLPYGGDSNMHLEAAV